MTQTLGTFAPTGAKPPETKGGEWVQCTAAEYALLNDDERCFWASDEKWRCGPLPRTYEDIMNGRPSSVKFTTMRRIIEETP